MVGLIVSWRGDRGMPLPEDNLLAFSYLIPVERIAELSPTVDKLIRSDAWDHGFERRLHTWFDDPDEDPVKITVVSPDSGKDRSLRPPLHRATLRYQGGRSSRPQLAASALDYVAYPPGQYLAYWEWLLGTRLSPGPATLRDPRRPLTIAVDGLDQESEPRPLIELLAKLRKLGFRLLIVFRTDGGTGWTPARDELLEPALVDHADLLLTRLKALESDRKRQMSVVDSASLGTASEVAELRRAERRAIDGISDPQERLMRLRRLTKRLRTDIGFHARVDLRSHGGRA